METALFILFGFFGLMILGMPIGYSMLVTAIFTLKTFHNAIPLSIVPQRIFAGVNNFILLCIPFFMLAGEMMAITPLFEKLIKLFRAFLGHVKGGLSHVNIVVSMFFAGITGAATADTSAVGGLLIPAMEKDGYTRSYATAVTVSSSTIGVIIPPSNLMIVAALATSSSVAVLFMAGLVPGILSGLGQLVVSLIYAKRKGFPSAHRMDWKERVQVFWAGIPAIGIPVIIFGGILGGVFTPTEAAAMTVFYAVIVGIFLLRSFPSPQLLYKTLLTVVQRLGAVMLAVGAAMVLGWIFAIAQIPSAIGTWITSVTTNPILITAGMLVTFLVIGTFLDPLPAILIFTPIFLPIAQQIGMGKVHFTITMVFGFVIGLITPPVGSCLYVGAAISGLRVEQFIKDLVPFIVAISLVLLLVAFFPPIVEFVPNLMFE
ncbi:TRAP transporter large permease [Marispirochaeta sp.]|uniref:TRAP transporter large permease n=1 Tax=Marispirochaeta sp. TaxID=2038653 RepID=UPI0029C85178|nr:TRAP transporter large permease [Marispirochaeta sp.]